jgi:hypothetical protein
MTDLIDTRGVARMFDVKIDTVRKWRNRSPDFPEPVVGSIKDHHPWYDPGDITHWYLARWPERSATWPVRLHRFYVSGADGSREETTIDFGPVMEARGYLRAVADLQYRDWRTWRSSEGLVAERGNDTHIWFLDPTGDEPLDWFVYQARVKGGSK